MYIDCLNGLTCHGLAHWRSQYELLSTVLWRTVYIGYIHKNLPDRKQSSVHSKLYAFTKVRPYRLCKNRPAGLLNDHHHCHSARVAGAAAGTRPQVCMLITLVYTLSLFCNRQLEELCPQSPQVWKVLVLFLVSAAFPVPNEMRISLASVFIRSEHQSRYGASFVSGTEEKQGAESHKSP